MLSLHRNYKDINALVNRTVTNFVLLIELTRNIIKKEKYYETSQRVLHDWIRLDEHCEFDINVLYTSPSKTSNDHDKLSMPISVTVFV